MKKLLFLLMMFPVIADASPRCIQTDNSDRALFSGSPTNQLTFPDGRAITVRCTRGMGINRWISYWGELCRGDYIMGSRYEDERPYACLVVSLKAPKKQSSRRYLPRHELEFGPAIGGHYHGEY